MITFLWTVIVVALVVYVVSAGICMCMAVPIWINAWKSRKDMVVLWSLAAELQSVLMPVVNTYNAYRVVRSWLGFAPM